MEYIKKEELIKGKIYTHQNGNICRYDQIVNNSIIGKHLGYNKSEFRKPPNNLGNFNIDEMKLSTPEEKHWLEICINADKFIEYNKAMKSFIPEYVECIVGYSGMTNISAKIGKIYKTSEEPEFSIYKWDYLFKNHLHKFKSSTKKAYDAQFIVKEPEFILPEKWYIKTNLDNLTIISNWFNKNKQNNIDDYHTLRKDGITPVYEQLCFPGIVKYSVTYHGLPNNMLDNTYKEITFEQFKKYVLKDETIKEKIIEPLPQFKVIETIETITKVENNEGNQFFIGDIVKSDKNAIYNIVGFKYNINKTDIIALVTKSPLMGISINKIEHYIESKVEKVVIEETLLEKAKRLYPIGTEFNAARGTKNYYKVRNNSEFKEMPDGAICIELYGNGTIYYDGNWGEIIK